MAASQVPSISDNWEDPQGVLIDAIIFGGRRATNVPLVAEARDWEHGVFVGATISSERTAAAEGTVGELRRDPFAMLPFCGYNMADHWQHWLDVGADLRAAGCVPRIFQVNWFRKGEDGEFLWPGFGDNSRVLAWILDRVEGRAAAVESPVGWLPAPGAIDLDGAGVSDADWQELFRIDPAAHLAEADDAEAFFAGFGGRVPAAVTAQLEELRTRMRAATGVAPHDIQTRKGPTTRWRRALLSVARAQRSGAAVRLRGCRDIHREVRWRSAPSGRES